MSLDELRREFEGWKSRQPKIIDDADLSYIGKFVVEKLNTAIPSLRESRNETTIDDIKNGVNKGIKLLESLVELINEHSQDFTHKQRIEELKKIEAVKNKMQNEIWSLKADILNKAVDAAEKQVPKWASGFMKVGMTLITSSLAAIGITYASSIEGGTISNITIGAIFILLFLGISLFAIGSYIVIKAEELKKKEFDNFLNYLKKRMKIDKESS